LREAIGKINEETGKWELLEPDPRAYDELTEPHDRGALLVAAIFDAFLAIYRSRVADLIRLATGGSGVLAEGALPPDLANRLTREAAKSAQHVLTMCIRALDYCPPVDITFGDFLRAIITADTDLVVEDDRFLSGSLYRGFPTARNLPARHSALVGESPSLVSRRCARSECPKRCTADSPGTAKPAKQGAVPTHPRGGF